MEKFINPDEIIISDKVRQREAISPDADTVNRYAELLNQGAQFPPIVCFDIEGDIHIAAVSVRVDEDAPHGHLMTGQPALFTFDLEGKDLSADIVFTVYDHRGQPICRFTSFECGVGDATARRYTCAIDEWPLVPGRYRINAAVFANGESQDHLEGAAVFDVEPGTVGGRSIGHDANYGCVAVAHNWLTPSDANT